VIANLNNTSHQSGYKVLIIEPAELLNIAAANALLKTLEEPALHTVIILVSSCPGILPATIRSRCQILSIDVPKYFVAEAWLKKQEPNADAVLLLALTENAPLKALNLARNEMLSKRQEFFAGLDALWQGESSLIQVVSQCLGWELDEFLTILMYIISDIIKIKFNAARGVMNLDQIARLNDFAAKIDMHKLFSYKDHLYELRRHLFNKINLNRQVVIENSLIAWMNTNKSIC
jgi:DNA polymerase-3 subunit delta'